jgi:hypothetical protein
MRKLAAAAALSAAVGAGVVAVATEANAGTLQSVGTIKLPTTSYTSPSNETAPVHYGIQPGQRVTVVCYTEGQSVNGNDYWFRISLDGRAGFVNRDAIVPDGYVEHC